MSLQHSYMVTNLLAGLAPSAFSVDLGSGVVAVTSTYLNDARSDQLWRPGSVVASDWSLFVDLGSAQAVSAVALININSPASAAVEIIGADNAAMSTNPVSAKANSQLATPDDYTRSYVLQFPSVTKRYWQLSFETSDPWSVELGEVFFGVPTALTRAIVQGARKRRIHKTTQNESDAGVMFGHRLAGPHLLRELRWEDVSAAEAEEIVAMHDAAHGNARNLLWIETVGSSSSAATSAEQECVYGRFVEPEIGQTEDDYLRFGDLGLTIREHSRGVGR
jgi:hypothetical protein